MPLSPFPDRIGPYLPEELVGRGGMAAVYRCRDASGEVVAVKWLHQPSAALASRFELEIRSLARLDHPGVVRYVGHGDHLGRPYLVMEYLEGEDLRLWAHRLRSLPPMERHKRVRALAIRIAQALAYVHTAGLVHRDVKPSNLRVIQDDAPVLTDFGVVKDLADRSETVAGIVIGTLHYAAPEQIRGDPVDARTDLYGLGCTLYTVLVDRRPFEGSSRAQLMQAHLETPPTSPSVHEPTVPPDLDQLILELMAKRPVDRPPDALDVVRRLRATEPERGVPLAGRQAALDLVARALDRVASGRGTVVGVSGPPGSGRSWILRTLGEGAARRGLRFVTATDPKALELACRRAQEDPTLIATDHPSVSGDIHIALQPLGPADLRRSVVAAHRGIEEPAALSEKLFRATGGLPALLVPLLERLQKDPHSLDAGLPRLPIERWFSGLDLDSLEVLQAMATARQPLAIPMIERIALVPAEEPIRDLVERGLVQTVPAGEGPRGQEGATRYAVAAGAFQDAALASVPDPEGLARRVEAALGRPPEERRATSDAEEGWVGRLGYAMGLRDEGRWEEAHFALSQLLLEAERLGEPTLLARATVGLGSVEWGLGRPAEAEVSLRRALALAPDDLQVRGNASNALGILEVQAGRPLAALALFDQATLAFQRAHLPAREVASWLNLAEARSMVGRLAGALDASERAVHLSRALGQAPLECASLRHKGLVLLDVGLAEEAGRVLADASALAHAAELPAERLAAHVLRAQASLDLDPGTRTAAAVAVDRLLRSVLDTSIPDPEGHRGLAWGILARAAAVLGDARLFQRSVDQTSNVEIEKISPTWIRIQLQLTRAFWTAGRRTRAAEIAKKAHANAEEQGFLLLAYEAQRLVARFMGTTPQPPGDLGEGLSQRALAALEKKPSFP